MWPAFHGCQVFYGKLGPDSIYKYFTSVGNPIVEIGRSYDRLISTMGFPVLVRQHLYIESGPWLGVPISAVAVLKEPPEHAVAQLCIHYMEWDYL